MKVDVYVPETWTEVDMTWDEIMRALDITEHADDVKRLVSEYYSMLGAISDDVIGDLEPKVKQIIADGLRRQAARFDGGES